MNSDTNNVEQISDLIKGNLSNTLKGETVVEGQFSSPEDYLKQTGKRFRMTKDQVTRGISREEAFSEFMRDYKG